MTITFTFQHPDADLAQVRSVVEQLRQKATGILWITVMPTSDPAVFSTLTRGDVTRPVPRRYLREAESRRERLIPYASE